MRAVSQLVLMRLNYVLIVLPNAGVGRKVISDNETKFVRSARFRSADSQHSAAARRSHHRTSFWVFAACLGSPRDIPRLREYRGTRGWRETKARIINILGNQHRSNNNGDESLPVCFDARSGRCERGPRRC